MFTRLNCFSFCDAGVFTIVCVYGKAHRRKPYVDLYLSSFTHGMCYLVVSCYCAGSTCTSVFSRLYNNIEVDAGFLYRIKFVNLNSNIKLILKGQPYVCMTIHCIQIVSFDGGYLTSLVNIAIKIHHHYYY